MYQVFYRCLKTNTLKTYCACDMPLAVAERSRDKFNEKYYNKPYPNGKGFYEVGKAWVGKV